MADSSGALGQEIMGSSAVSAVPSPTIDRRRTTEGVGERGSGRAKERRSKRAKEPRPVKDSQSSRSATVVGRRSSVVGQRRRVGQAAAPNMRPREGVMTLGFYAAGFAGLTIEEMLEWGGQVGYLAIELVCYPRATT